MKAPRTPRADDNPIFNPSSADIRQVDQFEKYTAGAGHAFYTSERFPQEWRERTAFVTEGTGKLVGTFDIIPKGAGYKAVQRFNNLYNSADAWSGPVCAETGPDGAMWVCDWYNLIIQHNPTPNKQSSGLDAKNGKGNAYETPLRDTQYGRVYRIYPKDSKDDANPGLDPAKPESLLAGLDSPNLFWRLHAQRLIVEGGMKNLAEKLGSLAAAGTKGSAHAVYALAQLGVLDASTASIALKSNVRAVQRAGITVATPQQLKEAYLAGGKIDVKGDRELAEALVSLSRLPENDTDLGKALFTLISTDEQRVLGDTTLKDGWQIAANRNAASVTAAAKAAGFVSDSEQKQLPNLLPNPDFSEVSNGQPAGWTDLRTYGGGSGSAKLTSSPQGRNGSLGLAISSSAPIDAGAAATVPVKRNTSYKLSAWVKTVDHKPNGNGPGALLNVHGGERTNAVKGNTDWTQVSVDIDSGDRNEFLIHCLFGGYGGGTGTVIYDDVSLTEVAGGSGAKGILAALASKAAGGPDPNAVVKKFKPDTEVHKRGAEVYGMTCIACHQPTGMGMEGAFPPLDGSEWLTGDPSVPIRVVIGGLTGPVKVAGHDYNSVMPPHVDLDDQKISDVLTYTRQSWSNDAAPVTPAQVKEVRDKYKGRTQPWTAKELGH
jgi:mono/diheme cytochrome c family protein